MDPVIEEISVEEAHHRQHSGVPLIDVREPGETALGLPEGALAVPRARLESDPGAYHANREAPLLLACGSGKRSLLAAQALQAQGYTRLASVSGGFAAWQAAGRPVAELPQVGPPELAERLAGGEPIHVLDVRTDAEWAEGHVAGAEHLMGGYIPKQLDRLPRDVPLALICRSGNRSTLAASVLARAGFQQLMNVAGGMRAWRRAGLPVVNGQGAET